MASYLKKGQTYKEHFLKSRILKLLPAFIGINGLFSVAFILWGKKNIQLLVDHFLQTGMPPVGATWYVIEILALYAALYVAMSITNNTKRIIIITSILTVLFCIVTSLWGWYDVWWISSFAFPLGLTYKYVERDFITVLNLYYTTILVVSVLILSALSCLLTGGIRIIVVNTVVAIPVILCLYRIENVFKNKILLFIGGLSYHIYLVHDCVLAVLYGRAIPPVFYLIIVYTLSIVFAITVRNVENKLVK